MVSAKGVDYYWEADGRPFMHHFITKADSRGRLRRGVCGGVWWLGSLIVMEITIPYPDRHRFPIQFTRPLVAQ